MMPWPLPWYMQGVMLDGRPEETEEISDILGEDLENLVQETQGENLDEIILVQESPKQDKWTRIQKRGNRGEMRDLRIRIPKN